MNLNKAILVGNITRDPELKTMPNGTSVCNFSIATNRIWNDKQGQKQQAVEFHNIVVFGRMADTVGQYMKKGSQILIEGRLQTRTWEKDGHNNYRTEIVAESVQFGAKPKSAQENQEAVQPSTPEQDVVQTSDPEPETESKGEQSEIKIEDIPF